MSMESDLATLLKTVCARTFPDVAPAGTAKPYVTWQLIGGLSWRYVDGTATDKRNTMVQINAWSMSRLESLSVARQIEDALCASLDFAVQPEGEPQCVYEEDTQLYGTIQRFTIVAAR